MTDTEVKTLCTLTISTHTSRVGCDGNTHRYHTSLNKFLLTHPVWDVTWYGRSFPFYIRISTHTSRVGCDSIILMLLSPEKGFLLTHPVWDVTIHGRWAEICNRISTHTSRVGCDKRFLHFFSCLNISTHTSRVGCDYNCIDRKCCLVIFLLTHPVWDVTAIYSIFQSHYSHILQDGPIIHLELY